MPSGAPMAAPPGLAPPLGPADLIARKTGEGYDRPQGDQLMPLDINSKLLIEWLATRKQLVPDWSKRLVAIQAKAADLYKELKPELLAQLKGGPDAPLDYLRAVEIRDLLAKTAERTLFGGLTGPAAEWDKVVKAYDKGGIQLGEASLNLVQNAEYELPFVRKQAAKLRQQVEDSERRQAEYARSAAACATAYQQECAKLGISAKAGDVKRQLAGLASQLPQCMESTVLGTLQAPLLADAIKHYGQFVSFAHQLPADTRVLPTLLEVHQGRTAAPAPTQQQPTAAAATTSGDSATATPAAPAAAAAISWDLDVAAAPAASSTGGGGGGISWDLTGEEMAAAAESGGAAGQPQEALSNGIAWDVGAVQVEMDGEQGAASPATAAAAGGGGVNWEITLEPGAEAGQVQGEQGQASHVPTISIDWDISISAAEAAAAGGASGQGADAANQGGHQQQGPAGDAAGVPGGAVVARLCADGEYRAALVDDLLELRAFLVQRRSEQSSHLLTSSSMPEELQSVQGDVLASMSALVDAALAAFRADRISQLLMLSSSQRYVDRLAGALARKAGQEAKMHAAAKGAVQRGHEAKAQLVECSKKVVELVERTRVLKAHAEASISVLFQRRRINIMGDINTALASTLA